MHKEITLLDESIDIWWGRVKSNLEFSVDTDCPLCINYVLNDDEESCDHCPIRIETGAEMCLNTSFYLTGVLTWDNHMLSELYEVRRRTVARLLNENN